MTTCALASPPNGRAHCVKSDDIEALESRTTALENLGRQQSEVLGKILAESQGARAAAERSANETFAVAQRLDNFERKVHSELRGVDCRIDALENAADDDDTDIMTPEQLRKNRRQMKGMLAGLRDEMAQLRVEADAKDQRAKEAEERAAAREHERDMANIAMRKAIWAGALAVLSTIAGAVAVYLTSFAN